MFKNLLRVITLRFFSRQILHKKYFLSSREIKLSKHETRHRSDSFGKLIRIDCDLDDKSTNNLKNHRDTNFGIVLSYQKKKILLILILNVISVCSLNTHDIEFN